jgi:peptidoglycan/LPS O-acetylase OafA/YrhL
LSIRLMVLYYVHRYIRLTPAFILVMLFSVYLTPYFGHGPLYPVQKGFEPDKCRAGNWWIAFLYIGNFFKSNDICLGITWYLYDDMQFYWIAPLAMIPFAMGKRLIGYVISILLICVHLGSTLGLLLHYPGLVAQSVGRPTNQVSALIMTIIARCHSQLD